MGQTLNGLSTIDPAEARRWAVRHGTPLDFVGRANAYRNQLGREPAVSNFLMLRQDIDELVKNKDIKLVWKIGEDTRTVEGLVFDQTSCMNIAVEGSKTALHLVDLQDRRALLRLSDIDAHYNVRARGAGNAAILNGDSDQYKPKYFYKESLDSDTEDTDNILWTWQTMLDDIWNNYLPDIAGTAPTLPYSPNGKPENFQFVGVSAWNAYNDILDLLGCAIKIDESAKFSIIRLNGKQSDLDVDDLNRVYGADPVIESRLDVAEKVRVYFYKHQERAGRERDTPRESNNWMFNDAVYTIEKDTSIANAEKGTIIAIWNNMAAIVQDDDLVYNTTELDDRAEEVKDNYVARVIQQDREKHEFYSGINEIPLGAQARYLVWRDYGSSMGGPVTEIGFNQLPWSNTNSIIKPIDFNFKSRPAMIPEPVQLVQVWNTDGLPNDFKDLETEDANYYVKGRVIRWKTPGAGFDTLEPCWITFLDDIEEVSRSNGDVTAQTGEIFLGRLIDSKDEKPIYGVRRGMGWNGTRALVITATVDANFTTSDASVAGTHVSSFLGFNPDPDTEGLTLYNQTGMFDGVSGDLVIAIAREDGVRNYNIINKVC